MTSTYIIQEAVERRRSLSTATTHGDEDTAAQSSTSIAPSLTEQVINYVIRNSKPKFKKNKTHDHIIKYMSMSNTFEQP